MQFFEPNFVYLSLNQYNNLENSNQWYNCASRKQLSLYCFVRRSLSSRSSYKSWIQSSDCMHCLLFSAHLSSNKVNLPSTGKEKWAILDSLSFHEFSKTNHRFSPLFLLLRYPKIDILEIYNTTDIVGVWTRFFSVIWPIEYLSMYPI